MSKREGCIIVLVSMVITALGLLSLVSLAFPWDTSGEGYRGND